ncbi:MAG: hypothetical protein ACPGVO_05945 [Spirulinaceae cyanobacterium]
MQHYSEQWLHDWCDKQGWTDLFQERPNHYWAFPPGAVMPEPIPPKVLRQIKQTRGWCAQERRLIAIGWLVAVVSLLVTGLMRSPLPLMFVFIDGAVVSALLEVEY